MEIFLKILVIIVIVFILYISFSTSRVKEGLTGLSSSTTSTTTSSTTSPPGIASSATSYASTINNKVPQLNDALLISKYNSDYVSVVDAMQNYINALSLEAVLNISSSDLANNNITSTLETLNTYNGAQTSLNNVLKYLNAN